MCNKNFIVKNTLKVIIICMVGVIIAITMIANKNTDIATKLAQQNEENNGKRLTEIKAGEPNTENFHYETSLDGHLVPVPNGFVGSCAEDEKYVNGITDTIKYYFNSNPTLVPSSGECTWVKNTNGYYWLSGSYDESYDSPRVELSSADIIISDEPSVLKIRGRVSWVSRCPHCFCKRYYE